MNIFGVGTTEMVIIVLIMLIVAGPKRMVRWAYHIGVYVGKFRKMWSEVVDVVQKEIDEAGVDVKIPKEIPTRQNIGKYVSEIAKPYTKELEQAAKDVQNPVKESLDTADTMMKAAATDLAKPKFVKQEKKAESPAASTLGSWGQGATSADKATDAPRSDENGSFGAWSHPKSPGQQLEQES
jgi:Sec-independent protein translocase protein TatA